MLVEKTDIEGCATFWRLTPGTYRVAVTLPKGYIIGPMGEKINGWYNCFPPQDGAFSMTEPIDVARGESLGLGVGAVSSGSVAGTVWADNDCNGLRSAQEGGFAGAEISLVSEAAGVSRQAITDETGMVYESQDQHGQYRADGAKPDQTEAILLRAVVAADGGYADAHRHDERYGHRACRHTAGIKRDSEKSTVGQ